MPVPREEEPELPSERDVRDAAQWMAEEHNMLQQEAGPWLAREIASRGGIAPYRRGYLKEEYKEIPLHLKNKRGLKLDEMASERRSWSRPYTRHTQKARGSRGERPGKTSSALRIP